MHFLAVLGSPDSQNLLATAEQMTDIMAGYATLYAYDNLSTDPSPGKHLLSSTHVCDNLGLAYSCRIVRRRVEVYVLASGSAYNSMMPINPKPQLVPLMYTRPPQQAGLSAFRIC